MRSVLPLAQVSDSTLIMSDSALVTPCYATWMLTDVYHRHNILENSSHLLK